MNKTNAQLGWLVIPLMVTGCQRDTTENSPVTTKSPAGTSTAPSSEAAEERDTALVRVVHAIPGGGNVDVFADDARAFDAEIRPQVHAMLSRPTASVLVTTDRFETDAPGVRARANSMTVVCVDREALEELGGVATEEVLAQLEDVDRIDCADLPGTPD